MPAAPPLHGDANGDEIVNLRDFTIVGNNIGREGASFAHGDFNGDGTVSLLDFNILSINFGRRTW
jgi:hypothetical protein